MALCVHYMLTPFLLAFLTALLAQAYATVVKSMMHGPCGELDPKAACMENGHCTKKYPHQFQPTTMAAQDSYPLYRRTEGPTARVRGKMLDNRYGHSCACAMSIPFHVLNSRAYIVCIHIHRLHITYTQPTKTHTHTHTNSWVVPHNVFLATKYNCHINVEVVSSIKAVKYLYKYVYKGPDRCTVEIGPVDEIKQFMDARYVAAPEAAWRIFGFELYDNKPAVYRLAIHTPEEQSVVFDEADDPNDVAARAQSSLLAYFQAMQDYPEFRHMKYQDMHKELRYHKTGEHKGTWTPRARGQKFPTVGRIFNISRSQGEVYFIRLLLLHTPGATGWEDLRTVDRVVCETFEDACRQLGLLDDDRDHIAAFREAREFRYCPIPPSTFRNHSHYWV